MGRTCERVRADLSAYVDETLPERRWQLISYHLAGCASCRAEMQELCSVRQKLSACRRSDTPSDLTARLEQIAGDHADAPLYLSGKAGGLPTSRQTRNRRLAASGATLLAVALAVVVLAVLIAPEPLRVTNPIKSARELYSLSASAVSVNEAVGAVLLAADKGADLGASISYQQRGFDGAAHEVSADEAADLLQAAKNVEVPYSGVQRVWISDGEGHFRSADVRVAKQPGEGALLRVLDSRGDEFSSSFLPDYIPGDYEGPTGWEFKVADEAETLGSRRAVHLSASLGGSPVAGWWVDQDTGILLWSERYDAAGDVTLAVGFTSLDVGAADVSGDVTATYALEPASSSGSAGWCVGLPACPDSVAGLPLVAYSSTERTEGRSMVLVYSDGFQTAVVGWGLGVMSESGMVTSSSTSLPSVRVWQHDQEVITVATNGSETLLDDVVAQLPEAESHHESILDRIAAGLRRLVTLS